MLNNCVFCEEFQCQSFILKNEDFGNRVLYETENFKVLPGLGHIMEGYLLIVSKDHYISVGELPGKLFKELEELQNKVSQVISKNYGTPVFFEHGPAACGNKGGSCIDHAHIHALPLEQSIFEDIKKDYNKYYKIKSLEEIKQQFVKDQSYFFLETQSKDRYIFPLSGIIPSQYIRKVIAEKTGQPEIWDWRQHEGLDKLKNTIKKLKDKF